MRSAREIAFLLLRATGIPTLLRVVLQRNTVTILCYHNPVADVLSRHLEILQKRYRFISLRSYVDWRLGRGPAPPRYAMILTLDDGHRGNAALRDVLSQHGIEATIFLCSGIVATRRHYWWTAVREVRDRDQLKSLADSERVVRLRTMGFEETHEFGERQALSEHEVHLLQPVADLQSHTRFHPILPRCRDARAWEEVAGSKADLETKIRTQVYALAYPNGDYSDREMRYARDAGYECAVTLDGGYNWKYTDLFALRRMPMSDDAGSHEVIVKASGMWDVLRRLAGAREYGYVPSTPVTSAGGQ